MKKSILLAAIVAVFASCSKDKINKSEQIQSVVSVENGYLKFRDQKAFDSVTNALLSKNPKQILDWEKGLDFISYNTLFRQIQLAYDKVNDDQSFHNFKTQYADWVHINPDSSITYKFGTPLSAYFINKHGEVKVGNDFRKFTNDGKVIIDNGIQKREIELKLKETLKTVDVQYSNHDKVSIGGPGPGGSFVNGIVKQELYYNSSNDRRLYVQLWYEQLTPNPPGPDRGTGRFYFVVLQELKRTFGGWRANNTDYYQNAINWNWLLIDSPYAPITGGYTAGYLAYPNTTGPIVFGMGSFTGEPTSTWGTAHFVTGGVPSTPTFTALP